MSLLVTVLGGGTGSFNVLKGLRAYPQLDLCSIVTMMDSGGDSGRLRDEHGVLPPGDLRRCLVALSEESDLLRELFSFRFNEPPLDGRSFGNLLFLALARILGSEEESLKATSKMLKIRGRVLPVTWTHSHLFAELADGTTVEGEANIDVPKHDASVPIERVYLEPPAVANEEAVAAIVGADLIVLAPGDLYTSTIANLLVDGIPQALQACKAQLVYIVNLMTKYGETHRYAASHHVERIGHYGGRIPDAVLVHSGSVPAELVRRYGAEKAHQVRIDEERLRQLGVGTIHFADVMSATSYVRHDPTRVAAALVGMLAALRSPDKASAEKASGPGLGG